MFKKLLIANRGEIACRVIKTAKRLGVATVAVYSDADAKAQHVKLADQSLRIGSAAARDSYLKIDTIIAAAKTAGADAIHPGYGFLSENADFAAACADNNLTFVGPGVSAIKAMGSKSAAKVIMEKAGVPLVPGYHGDDQSLTTLKQAADDMGYPVLLKAVSGGGGKGMRQVANTDEFEEALMTAKREALASFGDDVMLVERYLQQPRHVEVQVFLDEFGDGVYLFERDCSVQRRHQKIIEEAPAPDITQELRQQLGEAALEAAAAIDYVGAGTVEFLLDVDGSFYFMEMNTRLQVEHPVTELITGQDLVEWQLRVASGESLPLKQSELSIKGHAFEARIYAEDPNNQFLPQTGHLTFYMPPNESQYVRVDTGVQQGDEISVHYDPMIAKLVCWDEDRARALSRLEQALKEFRIAGLTTNIAFLRQLAGHEEFRAAHLSTAFINDNESTLWPEETVTEQDLLLVALYLAVRNQNATQVEHDPWLTLSHWRMNSNGQYTQQIEIPDDIESKSQTYSILVEPLGKNRFTLSLDDHSIEANGSIDGDDFSYSIKDALGDRVTVFYDGGPVAGSGKWFGEAMNIEFSVPSQDLGIDDEADVKGDFRAPMNGTVILVNVAPGDKVTKGQVLVVMEAMKMEHAIQAPADGEITEVFCEVSQLVDGGVPLLSFSEQEQ